jgi:tetratricopeptide (TPR) repeat protein
VCELKQEKTPKTVNLLLAILLISVFTFACIVVGYTVGYKYFWQKFDKTARVDRELFAYSAKVKQNPKDLDSLNKLAWLAFQKQQYDLAVQSCNRVLALNSKNANAHYVLALTFLTQSNLVEAEKEFTFLYENYPKNTLALLGLGQTFLAEGKIDKALPILESLVKLDKALADGHLYLGEAYFGLGQNDKALSEFKQALVFSPENQKAKDWIAKLKE